MNTEKQARGSWEFDEFGNPEFICECYYCLGFIDNVPFDHNEEK